MGIHPYFNNDTGACSHEDMTAHQAQADLDRDALARLEAYRDAYTAGTPPCNFDSELYGTVRIVSGTCSATGTSGTATFTTTFGEKYSNKTGSVHGGAIATLLDGLTNCAIAVVARKGFWDQGGVTKSLQIGYLRLIKKWEEVMITCEVVHAGSRTATIRATLSRAIDGQVLAVCTMEKGDAKGKAKL